MDSAVGGRVVEAAMSYSCHGSIAPSRSCTIPLFSRYLVTNLMGADLNNIVKFQRLSDEHVQFLIYQLLRGLKVIYSIMTHRLYAMRCNAHSEPGNPNHCRQKTHASLKLYFISHFWLYDVQI